MILPRFLFYCLIILYVYTPCYAITWDSVRHSEYFASYCLIGGIATGLAAYTLYKKQTTHIWWWKYYPPVFSKNLKGNVQKIRYYQELDGNIQRCAVGNLSTKDDSKYCFIQYYVSPQHNNECGYEMLLNSLIVLKQFMPEDHDYQSTSNQYINYYKIIGDQESPSVEDLLKDNELRTHFFRKSNNNYDLVWRERVIINDRQMNEQIAQDFQDENFEEPKVNITPTDANILDCSDVAFLLNSILQKFPEMHKLLSFFIATQDHFLYSTLGVILPRSDNNNSKNINNYLMKTINQFKESLQSGKIGVMLTNVRTTSGGLHWISLILKKEDDKFIIVGTDSINRSILEKYPFVADLIKLLMHEQCTT